MEDLDTKIDAMGQKKLLSLIQENSVRVGKINIRFTKENKKNTMERMDAVYASYEKLLRSIPKDMFKVEKEIRKKFQVPIDPERHLRVITHLNREVDAILFELNKKYRDHFNLLGQAEELDRRIESSRAATKEKLESGMQKLIDTLNAEFSSDKKISPKELTEKYGIDQDTLIQLTLIPVLQEIHSIFAKLKDAGKDAAVLGGVHAGIVECVKRGKQIERDIPPAHKVSERKEWKMRVAREAMNLKEMIYSLHTLAKQAANPKEQRNAEIVEKAQIKIQESLMGNPDFDRVLSKWKPFYAIIND